MFDYLQQFNNLPKNLRDKVSSPEAMASLELIEKRYGVDLAMVVMKVMIKSLNLKELPAFFISEFNLDLNKANNLTQELKQKIFFLVAEYVGLEAELKTFDLYKDIDVLIKEANIVISSEVLLQRLSKILATYLKGVRSKIDTRESLAKNVAIGGLGLSDLEINRIIKICDSQRFKHDGYTNDKIVFPVPEKNRLNQIINNFEPAIASLALGASKLTSSVPEYDLKRALASGETKKIVTPEEQKFIAPTTRLNLPINNQAENKVSQAPEVKMVADVKKTEEVKVAAPAIQPTSLNQVINKPSVPLVSQEKVVAPTIQKPDSNSLFKKLFVDSQKQTKPGAIKFATLDQRDIMPEKNNVSNLKVKQPEVAEKLLKNQPPQVRPMVASSRVDTSVSGNRSKMQDVRVVPKIMGPLEELQFLDLTNFRRLGKTPAEITNKIFDKIKILEKDGYEKMIIGISVWKKSPMSRLYLKIIQEAVSSGITIQEVIKIRQNKQQENLTMEEIEAIINLNSRLVF